MNSVNKYSTKSRKYAIESRKDSEADRLKFMITNMATNKAYLYAINKSEDDNSEQILKNFRERFTWYRKGWRSIPKEAIKKGWFGEKFSKNVYPPLCIDLELAAVCDLACPHCYRQYIATPDKIMDMKLALKLIDQAADLGVPSMKFNWRGEPLLNPQIPDIIDYAKQKGILETIINTNATKLDNKMAKKLIDAGLDLMTYSFDGGTKETYELMRPGRFEKNSFDRVYSNIRNFSEIRNSLGSVFPRTKIQMVLTEDSFDEQDSFYSLFDDCVDDISVKQYTERGGKLTDLNDDLFEQANNFLSNNGISPDAQIMRDADESLYVSTGRLPCEQPYQRLLVTYDGKVSMCCYDWGSMHPVGYVDDLAIRLGESELEKIKNKSDNKDKGFDMMKLEMPPKFNVPEPIINTLQEIWIGKEIDRVRHSHVEGKLEEITICKGCPFKETYQWKKVDL